MKYLINFSYDGSCFNGFQRQKDKKTVQGEIEKALSNLDKKDVTIHASGRTDKGVHAINQYAHFNLTKKVKLYNLQKYLNKSLNGEIYIKNIKETDDNFHARYNVKKKTYSYYINMGNYNPIKRNYIYQLNEKLNIKAIKKSTKYLLGEHDFKSFQTGNDKENTIRTIYKIEITKQDNLLKITMTGNGFLRQMVRNIVAVVIEIGKEKEKPIYMKEILENKKRLGNMKSVPGCGLYLEEVSYID